MEEKKFKLNLDRCNKVLHAKAFGFFEPEDANGFVAEYTSNINTINAKEYELSFDCTELKVAGKDTKSGIDMTSMLKACLEQYKKDGFNKVTFHCKGNVLMKMQLGRLSKEVGLSNCEVKA
jgi:hypothetical protein